MTAGLYVATTEHTLSYSIVILGDSKEMRVAGNGNTTPQLPPIVPLGSAVPETWDMFLSIFIMGPQT